MYRAVPLGCNVGLASVIGRIAYSLPLPYKGAVKFTKKIRTFLSLIGPILIQCPSLMQVFASIRVHLKYILSVPKIEYFWCVDFFGQCAKRERETCLDLRNQELR